MRIFIVLATALVAMLSACSKQGVLDDQRANELHQVDSEMPKDLKVVALSLGEMGLTLDMVSSIHQVIQEEVESGMDEHVALSDLLKEELRVAGSRTPALTEFATALRTTLATKSELRSAFQVGQEVDLEQLLSDNRVTLYWPYAEDWDGKTLPTLTISPDNDRDSICVGYVLAEQNGVVKISQELLVDEDYALKNPVWVLNREAHSQLQESSPLRAKTDQLRSLRPIGGKFATLYLGSLKATRHHDVWHKGGDEYEMYIASPKHVVEDGKVKVLDSQHAFVREEFTRRQIRRQVKREFGRSKVLVSEWQNELNEIAVYIYENDASLTKKDNLKIGLSATWKGVTFGFNVELPYASGDDDLYKGVWRSNFIFSTGNFHAGKWVEHDAGGLKFTLPFGTNTVIYDPNNPIGFEPVTTE